MYGIVSRAPNYGQVSYSTFVKIGNGLIVEYDAV